MTTSFFLQNSHEKLRFQHRDGPLDDGTIIKIVGDGEVLMKAYFLKSSYENLEPIQRESWRRSLIRVSDWDIKPLLMDSIERSEYVIIIKVFDVWNNEEGFWPNYRLKLCKNDFRIMEKLSVVWKKFERQKNGENSTDSSMEDTDSEISEAPLSMLIDALGDDCFSPSDESVQEDTLLNHGLLEDVSIEDLEIQLATLCNEDFVIKPEENKILEEIPEWCQNSALSASSVSKITSSHSKHDNGKRIQQTTTVNNREPCDKSIVPQPSTSSSSSSSSSDKTIPGSPFFNQNESTTPEDGAQQQTISRADETLTPELYSSNEHQSENLLVAEYALLPTRRKPKITSDSSDSDSEEETRLHNLALPSHKAADTYDIQPAKQYENDDNVNKLLCSQETVLTVTSTADDEYGSSSLDHLQNNLSRNVLKKSNCDSSQESNCNNKTKCTGSSFLVTSTAHENNQLASSETSVFNYNADSNLPVPQSCSSNGNHPDSVNFNSNEVVTSTAKELNKPELRNTYLLNSNCNKRTFSIHQIDSLSSQSHGNSCHFNALTYASPSKRKHIESQDITDQSKLDALNKLKSLLQKPIITADQKITTNLSLPEDILTKINTYWSNDTSHHSIQ